MLSSRRLTAVTIGSLAISLGSWGVGYLPTATAAATSTTYYFHGAADPNDDANRANGTPSATFDQTAPTGSSDSTQTGTGNANPDSGGNPLAVYWQGPFAGRISGNMHFDWYWSTVNPTTTLAGETATVTIFGDGVKIGSGDVALTIGTSPTLNHSDVSGVDGVVAHELIVQVAVDHADTGRGVTAHYNSASSPSSFTVTTGADPVPDPTPTETTPPPACTNFCFSTPLVLPKSGQAGADNLDDTCYNPCGEPSLAVSPVDGTLYVSTPRTIVACCNTQSSPVWKSTDDGATWSDPIFPKGAEDATTGGDTELAVDKRGTVYEGELWLGSDSIYISSDKGQTWDWSPASHDLVADREWLAYEPKEDALYGYWDGFKGLMVAKAPLDTPLGSNAARFFPEHHVIVPECAAAVAVNCPDVPIDNVGDTPVIHQATSPGRPSVSPVDGTVYFPFPYQIAGKGIGIAYTEDGASSFKYSYVAGAGHGDFGDTGHDFPVSAVDAAGNLFVAWIEDKGDGYNLYLASSGDKGAHWTPPLEVSKGVSKTAVFPNVVAGAAGQVAVSWYGTQATGDPNGVPAAAAWSVYATEIENATDQTPSVTTSIVESAFHKGPICTHGLGCTGNSRNLLDFFDMQIDGKGQVGIVYTRDQAANPVKTEIAYSRQVSGCVLTAECAVSADLAEFPTQIAPVFFGVAVIGGLMLYRRRRRGLPA
jgi:hypothetical protein